MAPVVGPGSLLHLADLRGLARLAADGITGVTDVVEGVHQSVWSRLGLPQGARTRGLTGLVYRSVRTGTGLAARAVDALLAAAGQVRATPPEGQSSAARDGWLSALNGVLGDHLVATGNPLALPMSLRQDGVVLGHAGDVELVGHGGDVLVMLHGLCMNDRQWRVRLRDGGYVDHGATLSAAHGYTVVHVRYNSGLAIADNGLELAQALERLFAHWPVPLRSIAMLGHSMGGLVARSAIHQAVARQLHWPMQLRHLAFLGTPHHGAPLERAGSMVDSLLAASRHTAPFVRIGMVRSAGIVDLRHGRVLAGATSPPLPEGVACHAIAAVGGGRAGALAEQLLGDGLVPVDSALGRHPDAARTLAFDEGRTLLLRRTGHLGLLSSRAAGRQLVRWLAPTT